MDKKTYSILNGKLVLASRAAIAVADRGFRFGDGVFETIRVEKGVPYQWELHMARLQQSLIAISITNPTQEWEMQAKKLLRKNAISSGFLRIAVSRGVGSRGYAPFPPRMPPSWVIETLPALKPPTEPYRLWLSKYPRIPLVCLPVNSKLAQGLNNTLALMEAEQAQCHEALQLTTDGYIAEAASANIFWIRQGVLYTPSLDTGCLNGTTRDAIIRLSPLPLRMEKAGIRALQGAECAFLANCRLGVWPVAALEPLGLTFSTHHRAYKQLAGLLRADMEILCQKHRKRWMGRA